MKRRNFFLASLLTIPVASFAKFASYIRSKKGINTSAEEDRFKEVPPTGLKVSSEDTDGD